MYSNDNLISLYKLIGNYSNNSFSQQKNYNFIKTSSSTWPNQIFNLKSKSDNLNLILNDIEEAVANKQLPDFIMLDIDQNNEWEFEVFKIRNYRSGQWTAMYFNNLDGLQVDTVGTDFSIKRVNNKSSLKIWLEIVESELMNKMELSFATFNFLLKQNSCHFFLGFKNDIPISTSLVFLKNNIAGIYLISTKKIYRKNGYGRMITLFSLSHAAKQSCSQVNIQATEAGLNMYK